MDDQFEGPLMIDSVRRAVEMGYPAHDGDKWTVGSTRWVGATRPTILALPTAGARPADIKRVEAIVDRIDPPRAPRAVARRRALVRRDSGDELDIHAVRRGDLSRAWSSRPRRAIRDRARYVHILLRIGGAAHQSVRSLTIAPAVAAAVAQRLAADGIVTAVTLLNAARYLRGDGDNSICLTAVRLMGYGERPTSARLAIAAHPAMFRGVLMPARRAAWDSLAESATTYRLDIPPEHIPSAGVAGETAILCPLVDDEVDAIDAANSIMNKVLG